MDSLLPTERATRREVYQTRVRPWIEDRLARQPRGVAHPVWDFLFDYYSHAPGQLLRWSPGLGVELLGTNPDQTDFPRDFEATNQGCRLVVHRFPARRIESLQWACNYLRQIQNREPFWGCFGLHEWAMVYQTEAIRHRRVPLRLGSLGTDDVVDRYPLQCSHFDASRFFTPASQPKNRWPLSRAHTTQHDQPGCVHVVMDLYKFCYKIVPWIDSELLADAFELAVEGRRLDMRASPYDLRDYGLEPIAIETKPGREVYLQAQRELAQAGLQLRPRVIAAYERLLQELNQPISR